MSSIYRKKRDGYFYYQTYIYNPDTKKKDKKTYHSLGTKDRLIAEQKKIQLDSKYQKEGINSPYKLTFGLVFSAGTFIFLLVFMISSFMFEKINESSSPIMVSKTASLKSEGGKLDSTLQKESHEELNIEKIIIQNSQLPKEQLIVSVPNYELIREENISGVFNQGRIYLTVAENTKPEALKLLCESVSEKFRKYSNLVICVYSNDSIGKDLALNKNTNYISQKEKQNSWLAMYTYNPIEGSYFDDSPGEFLGLY